MIHLAYITLYSHLVIISIQGESITPKFKCSFENSQAACECDGLLPKSRFRSVGGDLMDAVTTDIQAEDLVGIKTVLLQKCHNKMILIDYDKLPLKDGYRPSITSFIFNNTGPIHVKLTGPVDQVEQNLFFENIHGTFEFGNHFDLVSSLVLSGGVDFCSHRCEADAYETLKGKPPSLKLECNHCQESNINLHFSKIDHVLFDELGIASYPSSEELGQATIKADNVGTLRRLESYLNRAVDNGINADGCWIDSNEVSCNDFVTGPIGAQFEMTIIFSVFGAIAVIIGTVTFIFTRKVNRSRQI